MELSRAGSALSSSRTSRHREGSDLPQPSALRRFSQHHTEGLWDRLSVCHIILLEAKGETGFTNKQLKSKACRLKAIFEGDEARSANACPHFAIVSKHKPVRLKYDCWPNWMHPNGQAAWIQLDMPDGLRKVTRCDDLGLDDSADKYWKVD
ncbi:MAG: hypothetical protein Q8O40_07385 [Chloroflexota bacterium]|nr:hypothetical protein [Chloroflexota bacterium]